MLPTWLTILLAALAGLIIGGTLVFYFIMRAVVGTIEKIAANR